METHDRRKYAQLIPAAFQLIIPIAKVMAANVMAPPAITNIGGCRSKVRLKIQSFPGNKAIAGKADRISVGARACIS